MLKEKKNLLINLLKLLITVYVLYFIFKKIPVDTLIASFINVRLRYLGAAVLLGFVFTLIKIFKWHLLLRDLIPDISFRSSIDGYLSGMSLGIITPGRIGEVGRISEIPKEKRLAGVGLVLWDKIFDLFIVVFLSLWGIWYFVNSGVAITAGVLLIALLFILFNTRYLNILLKLPVIKKYPQLLEGLNHLKRRTILTGLTLTLFSYLIVIFEVLLLVRAFGYNLGREIFISYPLVMLANLIPITVGGLGVREGIAILLLGRFGLPEELAFNSAFLIFLINTALPGFCGLFPMNRDILKSKFVPVAITVIAGLVRFYNIGARSIWLDEGITVNLAWDNIKNIILDRASTGIHPPLYFILTHFWIRIFGDSEVALRSFSAIFSVLSIPLIYKIASRIFDLPTAIIASLLFALSPFQIYYSQEARMYPLITFLFLLSLYLLYRWNEDRLKSDKKFLIPVVILNVISLYVHIYSVFLIVLENIYIFFTNIRDWKRLKCWVTYQLVIVLLFSPWIYVILKNRTPDVYQGKQSLTLSVIKNSFIEINLGYARGIFAERNLLQYIFYLFLALFIIGLLPPYRDKKGFFLVALYTFIPFLLLILISFDKSFFSARYLSPFVAGYFILLARGIRKFKFYPVVILILLLILGIDSLAIYNYNKKLDFISRPWRRVVEYIHSEVSDRTVALITAPQMYRPFNYYNRDKIPYEKIDAFGNVAVDIYRGTYSYKNVWFVMAGEESSDPRGKIKSWLDSKYKRLDMVEYYKLSAYLYEVPEEFNRVKVIFYSPDVDNIEFTVEIRYPESNTDNIIETFDKLKLKGTFFFTADAALTHKKVIKSLLDKGYEIGMLGESYVDYTTYSEEEITESLKKTEEIIEGIAGKEINLFRPPRAAFDKNLLNVAYKLGYTLKFWSSDIRRWTHYEPEAASEKLLKELSPGKIVNLGIWDNFSRSVLFSLLQVWHPEN